MTLQRWIPVKLIKQLPGPTAGDRIKIDGIFSKFQLDSCEAKKPKGKRRAIAICISRDILVYDLMFGSSGDLIAF
jgi:hypothetical protein